MRPLSSRFWTVAMVAIGLMVGLGPAACKALKKDYPLLKMSEYESMLAGRKDAKRVGMDSCLSSCHFHDETKRNFEASTMGAAMSAGTGLPAVDCESCHGPGSLAVAKLTVDNVAEELARGNQPACEYQALTPIKTLPAPAKALICMKCHTRNATFNLHEFRAGPHLTADVSCADCHDVHAGPDLILPHRVRTQLCVGCHESVQATMSLPSHHPVREGTMACTDCHDPHGASEGMLNKRSVRETCAKCHQAVATPRAFAHAEVLDECTSCHDPHGAVSDNLLKLSEPMLCLQCHSGHWVDGPGGVANTAEAKGAFYTRCTDCHGSIHGTDTPSPSGRGRFTR